MGYTEAEDDFSFFIDGLAVTDKEKAKALFDKFYNIDDISVEKEDNSKQVDTSEGNALADELLK